VAAEACELAARVRAGMSDRERLLDELRPVSFAIAYPMLGSVSEAEDVVQEALLRVHQALVGGRQIASPRAFVATATTRLAINELRSARARREHYVGEWLPEPVITDGHDDPARHAEMADSLSLAMLVVLESLSPEQRAVLLLHDVFDYNHAQIAQIIGKSQDNVRQIATRARRHVEQRRPRFQTTGEQRDAVSSSKPITYPDLVDAWPTTSTDSPASVLAASSRNGAAVSARSPSGVVGGSPSAPPVTDLSTTRRTRVTRRPGAIAGNSSSGPIAA
jgi:RNA polymerase sigma factor (sigma-70 family)